jgi:pilus assembly protein Flp/PilA
MRFAIHVLARLAHARRSEDGQDLLEYGMLAALIAVLAIGAVTSVGNVINNSFWRIIGAASF